MLRFDYNATGYGRPVTAEARPPEQVALRDGSGALLRRTVRFVDREADGADRERVVAGGRRSIVPFIVLVQLCCWYAVISLNHLGHAIEETLWSVLAFLVALSLGLNLGPMPGASRTLSGLGMVACAGAAFLMLAVDVPMYLARWRHGRSSGLRYLSLMEGLRDALQRRRVAHRWSEWRPEVPWMSLYFSVGVWLSLCLVFA